MKKFIFIFLVIVAAVVVYFVSPLSGSSEQGEKTGIGSMISSIPMPWKDYNQELAMKQAELKAREDVLKQVEAQIEQWKKEADSNICPQTGQSAIFQLKDDPRPKLEEEIGQLKQEIAKLELKVKK